MTWARMPATLLRPVAHVEDFRAGQRPTLPGWWTYQIRQPKYTRSMTWARMPATILRVEDFRAGQRPTLPGWCPCRVLAQAYQIGQQAVGSGDADRQLAVEGKSIVDIRSLAVFRQQQAALLRILLRIVRLHQRLILFIPSAHEA